MRRLSPLLLLLLLFLPVLAQGQPQPVKPDKKELARLAKLDKNQAAAKAAFAKSPKNAKVKSAYIKATLDVAYAYMTTPAVASKEKYPKSLRYYREVRKIDPKNKDANENIEMMEAIYRSIGKPIPPSP